MKAPAPNVDFGKTANDYLTHRAGFPESLFANLLDKQFVSSGQKAIDLGTGTGTLGRGLARLGCHVVGVDPSAPLLKAARTLDLAEDIETEYILASAEDTGLIARCADIIAAGQCWHWFDAPNAAKEIRRLLKPRGMLIVAYYDWLPLTGNMVRRTEELIEQYNPLWKAGNLTGIHPELFRDLGDAGFENIESFTYDEPAIYTHDSWRGRIRASAGVAATLEGHAVQRFDDDLTAMLASDYPTEPMFVPHRVFVTTATPPLA